MTTAPPTRPATDVGPHGVGERRDDPFGLPVLAELPELATALSALCAADRAIGTAIDQLVRLRRSGEVEATTGVGLDAWLSIVARRTGTDRRMLLTVAEVLGRLPHVHRCFSDGEVSWAQLRHIVLQIHRLAGVDDVVLDGAIAGAITDTADLEPDALTSAVRWVIADLTPRQDPSTERPDERLHLQPRLDGTGGAVVGELGAVGFAALDAVTRPEAGASERGRRRAEKLTALCLQRLPDTTSSAPPDAAGASGQGPVTGTGAHRPSSPVHLLLRVELETLLHLDDRPAQLLTGLAGGAMWTDAATSRELAAAAGSLRLIVTDGGAPVGIGRRSRDVPAWLRDAVLARHDTCTAPGCARPALTADIDHALPWADGGATDVDNLAPLCAHHNRDVTRRRWRVQQAADGTRRWVHPATGLRTATRPERPSRRPRGPTTPPTRAAPPPGSQRRLRSERPDAGAG